MSGIELTTSGNKIAWDIADYLDSLQSSLDNESDKSHHSKAKAKSKVKSGHKATPERPRDES